MIYFDASFVHEEMYMTFFYVYKFNIFCFPYDLGRFNGAFVMDEYGNWFGNWFQHISDGVSRQNDFIPGNFSCEIFCFPGSLHYDGLLLRCPRLGLLHDLIMYLDAGTRVHRLVCIGVA